MLFLTELQILQDDFSKAVDDRQNEAPSMRWDTPKKKVHELTEG